MLFYDKNLMAFYSRIEVVSRMKSVGIIPLFYHPDVKVGKAAIEACYLGGARVIEFTARGDFAMEVFGELNRYCLKELPGMILGVGSLTDAASASAYIQLGANFIVTPAFREDIALVCNRRKILWIPGCGTIREINQAEELGCELVKLFPGEVYGPSFVKAVKGPQPWTNIMPTGGVLPTEVSLKSWFDAGAFCVGLGSQLISSQLLESKDFVKLETDVRKVVELAGLVRGIA